MITIKVPASSANLGPGFDCFGIAWQLYNEISFAPAENSFSIKGCEKKYRNTENLAYTAYMSTLERAGKKCLGVSISFGPCDIPVSHGLGSSSALLVAGVMAANALHKLELSRDELFAIATALEGHPDNVAPAIYGGLTASAVEAGIPFRASFPLCEKLCFAVLIPPFQLATSKARSVLPHQVPRADAIFNVSRSALLLSALGSGDIPMLRAAMNDRLHEPYRIPLIDGFDTARGLACKHDAEGFCVSGAGPSLLAVSCNKSFCEDIKPDLAVHLPGWQVLELKADFEGAKIL